jgi:hypothetical protein
MLDRVRDRQLARAAPRNRCSPPRRCPVQTLLALSTRAHQVGVDQSSVKTMPLLIAIQAWIAVIARTGFTSSSSPKCLSEVV